MSFGPSACALLDTLAAQGLLRPGLELGLLGRPRVLPQTWANALPALAKRLATRPPHPEPAGPAGDTAQVLGQLGLSCRPLDQDTRPESLDLAANFGVSEHLVDQALAFESLHQALAVGGLAVHAVPGGGYAGHGLYRYPLGLFRILAQANGYEAVFLERTPDKPSAALGFGWPPGVEVDPGAGLADPPSWLSLAVLRKTRAAPFVCPCALSSRAFREQYLCAKPETPLELVLPCLAGPDFPDLLVDPALPLSLADMGLLEKPRLRLRAASDAEKAVSADLSVVMELKALRGGRPRDIRGRLDPA